jgi:uncharacterized protein (DUF952 family)
MATIYKICTAEEWSTAVAAGAFGGSTADRRDGFVHFSTIEQVAETAARHFANAAGLVIVAFDDQALGSQLRYEQSRDGSPFPHLYDVLNPELAIWSEPLPLGPDGRHIFPPRMR